MPSFRRSVIVLSGALLLLGAGAARAHDLHGIVAERNSLEPEAWKTIEQIRSLRRFLADRSGQSQDAELEAVVQRELTWPDSQVTVCFLDGSQQARDHVAEIAQRWMQSTGLVLEFGPAGNRNSCNTTSPANIRVSFVGSGYWSFVGIEAKKIDVRKQTLNLGGMNKTAFTADDDGVILHEFGHAIGFEHEHQSPISVCEREFDWDYLYRAMGWSPQKVDENMRQLQPSSKLLTTAFDAASIMLYSLEKEAFKEPAAAKCYIAKHNNVISELDREAAATVYPVRVSAAPQPLKRSTAAPPKPRDAAVNDALKRLRELTERSKR